MLQRLLRQGCGRARNEGRRAVKHQGLGRRSTLQQHRVQQEPQWAGWEGGGECRQGKERAAVRRDDVAGMGRGGTRGLLSTTRLAEVPAKEAAGIWAGRVLMLLLPSRAAPSALRGRAVPAVSIMQAARAS